MSYEQLAASVDALAEANRSLTEQSLETQAGSIAASDNATAKAQEAAQAALSAEDSARVATDAANQAKDSTDIMDSVEAGIAAGKPYFYTISPDSKQVLILWKNTAGVAVDTGKRTPSSVAVDAVTDELKIIADKSQTRYYEGGEVYSATVDSAGRASTVLLSDGTVKIPKLVLSNPALSVIQSKIDLALASTATIDAIWPTTALAAISLASRRRVDFVMIGDSNQRKDGYGWGGGLMRALHDRFGCYATSVASQSPINLSTYTLTGETNYGLGGGATYTGAPAYVEDVFPSYAFSIDGSMAGSGYAWMPDGTSISSGGGGGGVAVNASHAIGVSNKLRAHYGWVSLKEGTGQFRVGVRLDGAPFSTVVLGTVTQTNTGESSIHRDVLDIPAAPRTRGLECRWYLQNGTPLIGPMAAAWMRLENPDKKNGISVSTLYGAGGQSLYDMANYLLTAPTKVLIEWFSETRRLQLLTEDKPVVVIYINSALNDQNETLSPSWGWRASDTPSSTTAYIDNLEAICKRITDVWQKAGWDESELFFLTMPSHPVSNPDSAKLVSYRKAAQAFSGRQRSSFIDMTNITSSSEISANNWYMAGNTDFFHLVQAAYTALAARVVTLIPEAS